MRSCALEATTVTDKIFLLQLMFSLPKNLALAQSTLFSRNCHDGSLFWSRLLWKLLKINFLLSLKVPELQNRTGPCPHFSRVNSSSTAAHLTFSLLVPLLQIHPDLKKPGILENVCDILLPCNQLPFTSDSDSGLNSNLPWRWTHPPSSVWPRTCRSYPCFSQTAHLSPCDFSKNINIYWDLPSASHENSTTSEYSGNMQVTLSLNPSTYLVRFNNHLVSNVLMNPFGNSLLLCQGHS